jgi:hypothetical protein
VDPADLQNFLAVRALYLFSEANLIVFQALFATVPLYNASQTLYKLSITAQLYRVFDVYASKTKMLCLFSWIAVCGIAFISASIFYCWPVPVQKAWDDSVHGRCGNRSILNYVIAGFNILNDLPLFVMPMFIIRKLQKNRRFLYFVFAFVFGYGDLQSL